MRSELDKELDGTMIGGRTIVFFGLDGSGKTTQVELLLSYLCKRGIKTRRTWICSHHYLAWAISRIFVGFGRYEWRPGPESPNRKKYPPKGVVRGRLGRRIWLFSETFSIILAILLKERIPSLLGRTVIVERYVPGSLGDLYYMFGPQFLTTLSFRILMSLASSRRIRYVYLRSSDRTIKQRRGPAAEPPDYLSAQDWAYSYFAKCFRVSSLDTNQSNPIQTHAAVKAYLEALNP